MAKFIEGETVRSSLIHDRNFPFFQIVRIQVYRGDPMTYYTVSPMNNAMDPWNTTRSERVLRKVERDYAGDE